MVTCEAIGCRSRSGAGTGIKMNSFPSKDLERRMQWIKNAGLSYDPNKHAVLCELHFSADMWEKRRQDGSKKLKCNALPTIFGNKIHIRDSESRSPQSISDSYNGESTSDLPKNNIQDEHDTFGEDRTFKLSSKEVYSDENLNEPSKPLFEALLYVQPEEMKAKSKDMKNNYVLYISSQRVKAPTMENGDFIEDNGTKNVGSNDIHRSCREKYVRLMRSKVKMQKRHKALRQKWRKLVNNLHRKLATYKKNSYKNQLRINSTNISRKF